MFCTRITRYCAPEHGVQLFEKLTLPDSVGTFLNFSICAASRAPFVEPPARLIAVTSAVDRRRAGDEAARAPGLRDRALFRFASALTAWTGSSPNAEANVT